MVWSMHVLHACMLPGRAGTMQPAQRPMLAPCCVVARASGLHHPSLCLLGFPHGLILHQLCPTRVALSQLLHILVYTGTGPGWPHAPLHRAHPPASGGGRGAAVRVGGSERAGGGECRGAVQGRERGCEGVRAPEVGAVGRTALWRRQCKGGSGGAILDGTGAGVIKVEAVGRRALWVEGGVNGESTRTNVTPAVWGEQ